MPPPPWRRRLLAWMLAVALPLTIFYQADVGFAPLLSGRLVPFALPLVLLALLNGFTEELLFRGLLMPVMSCFPWKKVTVIRPR